MVKINPKKMLEKQEEFYNTVSPKYIELINKINDADYPEYRKLANYFKDEHGNISEEKIKKLILGDFNELVKAKNYIGVIKTKTILDNGYENIADAYEEFTKTDFSREWPEVIGVDSCPYCNRTYIYTIPHEKIRPDYDHYFPKSRYPYLCVSMFNLVPSCKQCNQHKGLQFKNVIYPYSEEYGEAGIFKIDLSMLKGITDLLNPSIKLPIKLEIDKKSPLKNKIKYSNEKFRIEKLYNMHGDYVRDIIKLHQIYTPDFLENIKSHFPWLTDSIIDTLYLTKTRSEDFHKRTLSKFTSDLLKQFDN